MANPRRQVVRIQPAGAGRMKAQDAPAINNPSRTTQVGAHLEEVKQDKQTTIVYPPANDLYQVLPEDDYIVCDTTAGPILVVLPIAVGIGGRVVTIKKTFASAINVVTISPASPAVIDGASPRVLSGADKGCVQLLADSVHNEWLIIGSFGTVT